MLRATQEAVFSRFSRLGSGRRYKMPLEAENLCQQYFVAIVYSNLSFLSATILCIRIYNYSYCNKVLFL